MAKLSRESNSDRMRHVVRLGTGKRKHVMARITPVPEHLATATHRVVRLGKEVTKYVGRGYAKGKDCRQVTIMGDEVIARGVERKGKPRRTSLVPGARDGKMNSPLPA